MGRLTVVIVVAIAGTLVAGPAQAAAPTRIAEALAADPVYVDPHADPALPVGDAGRVRLRIADKAIGRIRVAVLAPRDAARSGGLAGVANAIDRELRPRGALIATAGDGYHIVTSHPASGEAATAVRTAVRTHDNLAGRLLAAVDGVAAADPGPGADLNAGAGSGAPPGEARTRFDDRTDDLFGAFRLGVLVVASAIALPFVVVALLLLVRARRARARETERLAALRERADDELVTLGDTIRELELDVSLPGVDPAGRADYDQAVVLYDEANGLLSDGEPSETQVAEACKALAEGRRRMDRARAAFGAGVAGPTP